jgi:hypothetical protein
VSSVPPELVRELLTESLAAWGVAGDVSRQGDVIAISGARHSVRIEPAELGSMFRWRVTVGERKRAAISLVAVLRQVREALDPGYATNRLRVAVAPLVLS